MIETGFYCSLLWSCVFDHRRSDFVTVVIHHFVTIGLLFFRYIAIIGEEYGYLSNLVELFSNSKHLQKLPRKDSRGAPT